MKRFGPIDRVQHGDIGIGWPEHWVLFDTSTNPWTEFACAWAREDIYALRDQLNEALS